MKAIKKLVKGILIGIGTVVVLAVGCTAILSNNRDRDTPKTEFTVAENETEQQYEKVSVNTLIKDLEENAMKAQKNYKDKYLEITGRINNIDSDGKYFSLSSDDEFSLYSIQIFVNEKNKDEIVNLKKDENITVKVKVKDVGEVIGYSADLKSWQ